MAKKPWGSVEITTERTPFGFQWCNSKLTCVSYVNKSRAPIRASTSSPPRCEMIDATVCDDSMESPPPLLSWSPAGTSPPYAQFYVIRTSQRVYEPLTLIECPFLRPKWTVGPSSKKSPGQAGAGFPMSSATRTSRHGQSQIAASAGRKRQQPYFNALETELNVALRLLPRVCTDRDDCHRNTCRNQPILNCCRSRLILRELPEKSNHG